MVLLPLNCQLSTNLPLVKTMDCVANQTVTCRSDNEASPKPSDHVWAAGAGAKTILNDVFLSFQALESPIMTKGSNKHKLSHMSKVKLCHRGELPKSMITCDPEAIAGRNSILSHCS